MEVLSTKSLKDFLQNEGIQAQFTAPYSPEQNGVADRKKRLHVEMAMGLLIDADLDKSTGVT